MSKDRAGIRLNLRQQSPQDFHTENVKAAVPVQRPGHNDHRDSALGWFRNLLPQQTDAFCWQGNILLHSLFHDWGSIQALQGGLSLPPPLSQTILYGHCFLPCKYIYKLRWSFLTEFVDSQNVQVPKSISSFWEAGLSDQIKHHDNSYPISVFLKSFSSKRCTESHGCN